MSDDQHLNASVSPSGLGNPAYNVRRMTKLPLLIVGALIFVVIIALGFALYKRANKHKHQDAVQEEALNLRSVQEGARALLEGYEQDGMIPPAKSASTKAKPESKPSDQSSGKSGTAPPSHAAASLDEERKRLERARKFREDLFYDAVVSNTAIQIREHDDPKQEKRGDRATGALDGGNSMDSERQRRISESLRLAGMVGGGGSSDEVDPNLQTRKEAFQKTTKTYGYSTEFRQPQLTPYELRVGTIIPAVMIGGINSDLPGEIIAQVSQNVRDTRTGQYILIPQGARLIGTYDSHIAMGQRRVMVGWHRVQFPDGSTMELGHMGGVDPEGYAGFNDKVNNHYWRIFGNAILLSVIGAGAQLSQPDGDDDSKSSNAREELAAELGRQWGQVGQQTIRRNMNIQPTLEIRPGYQFNVMVNKDLILKPYSERPPGG